MKIAIICCLESNSSAEKHRCLEIQKFLRLGGVSTSFFPISTEQQLNQILSDKEFDIAFSPSTYVFDKNQKIRQIHQIFEQYQIPFIGSPSTSIDLVLSKSEIKKVWRKNNILTPDYFLITKNGDARLRKQELSDHKDYPYIVKPDKEGNSRGIDESSIVFTKQSLEKKIHELEEVYDSIIVEKFLGSLSPKREFTVAMIGNKSNKLVLPVEIIMKEDREITVITNVDKDNHNTLAIPVNDSSLQKKLIQLAENAFRVAGVQDYSRCDIIMFEGKLYVIEINGQPMIPDKWFGACAATVGINTSQYINAIFCSGISRLVAEMNLLCPFPKKMCNLLGENIVSRIC